MNTITTSVLASAQNLCRVAMDINDVDAFKEKGTAVAQLLGLNPPDVVAMLLLGNGSIFQWHDAGDGIPLVASPLGVSTDVEPFFGQTGLLTSHVVAVPGVEFSSDPQNPGGTGEES